MIGLTLERIFEIAIPLADALAAAWRALGWVKMNYDWDWLGADAAFRRALESKPGDAGALAESARTNRARIQ